MESIEELVKDGSRSNTHSFLRRMRGGADKIMGGGDQSMHNSVLEFLDAAESDKTLVDGLAQAHNWGPIGPYHAKEGPQEAVGRG